MGRYKQNTVFSVIARKGHLHIEQPWYQERDLLGEVLGSRAGSAASVTRLWDNIPEPKFSYMKGGITKAPLSLRALMRTKERTRLGNDKIAYRCKGYFSNDLWLCPEWWLLNFTVVGWIGNDLTPKINFFLQYKFTNNWKICLIYKL